MLSSACVKDIEKNAFSYISGSYYLSRESGIRNNAKTGQRLRHPGMGTGRHSSSHGWKVTSEPLSRRKQYRNEHL